VLSLLSGLELLDSVCKRVVGFSDFNGECGGNSVTRLAIAQLETSADFGTFANNALTKRVLLAEFCLAKFEKARLEIERLRSSHETTIEDLQDSLQSKVCL
jgi:hypothetical protein